MNVRQILVLVVHISSLFANHQDVHGKMFKMYLIYLKIKFLDYFLHIIHDMPTKLSQL